MRLLPSELRLVEGPSSRSWVWDRCLFLLEAPWEEQTSAAAAEEVAGSYPSEVAQTCFVAALLEEDRLQACSPCWDCASGLGSSEAAQGSRRAVAAASGLLPSEAEGFAAQEVLSAQAVAESPDEWPLVVAHPPAVAVPEACTK